MLNELGSPTSASMPVVEFAEHLRLGSGFADDGSQNTLLETCLRAALAAVEARIGLALLSRRFRWSLTRWSDEAGQVFPIAPVLELESVTLKDRVGDVIAVNPEIWVLIKDGRRPKLRGAGGYLPGFPTDGFAEVVFTGGYGATWDSVPHDLGRAVFLLAAHYYEQRSAADETVPVSVLSLLMPYRDIRLGISR